MAITFTSRPQARKRVCHHFPKKILVMSISLDLISLHINQNSWDGGNIPSWAEYPCYSIHNTTLTDLQTKQVCKQAIVKYFDMLTICCYVLFRSFSFDLVLKTKPKLVRMWKNALKRWINPVPQPMTQQNYGS
jgi:hypothetical protein